MGRRINSNQVIDLLAATMIEHGIPEYIRSGNGPEFVAKELRKRLAQTGARTLHIEPGSPWENSYWESFNSKMRDQFLNGGMCDLQFVFCDDLSQTRAGPTSFLPLL